VVDFSKIEGRAAGWANAERSARLIEITAGEIRVTVPIPKNAMAIAAFALMERTGVLRCRIREHDATHRDMVKIAEREELHLGMIAHDSSSDGIPSGGTGKNLIARLVRPRGN